MKRRYLYTRQRMLYASLCYLVVFFGFSSKIQAQQTFGKDFEHWANATDQNQWIGGNLNKQKATYAEGAVVPHAFRLESNNGQTLVIGASYSFSIIYDYYQSNTNAGGFKEIACFSGTGKRIYLVMQCSKNYFIK